MGKEWLVILMLAFASDPAQKGEPTNNSPPLVAAATSSTSPTTPTNNSASTPKPSAPVVQAKCEVGPYKSLVGRTISDVLTLKLPPGTRIYRLGDPVTQPVPSGRLNIEINRGTRVGRIYCS